MTAAFSRFHAGVAVGRHEQGPGQGISGCAVLEVDATLGAKLTAIIWDSPAETPQLAENAQPAPMAVLT